MASTKNPTPVEAGAGLVPFEKLQQEYIAPDRAKPPRELQTHVGRMTRAVDHPHAALAGVLR